MREINSETIAAKPHKHFVGKGGLEGRGEPDSGNGEIPSYGSPAAGEVDVLREIVLADPF